MEFIARVNVRDSEKVDNRLIELIEDLKRVRDGIDEVSNTLLKGIQIKIEDKQK